MSKSNGEGRSDAEKAARLLRDPVERQAQRARDAEEEARWAALSGPVTVRRKSEEEEEGQMDWTLTLVMALMALIVLAAWLVTG